eukprot:3067662-Rhodomonas_salina.2
MISRMRHGRCANLSGAGVVREEAAELVLLVVLVFAHSLQQLRPVQPIARSLRASLARKLSSTHACWVSPGLPTARAAERAAYHKRLDLGLLHLLQRLVLDLELACDLGLDGRVQCLRNAARPEHERLKRVRLRLVERKVRQLHLDLACTARVL